MLEIKFLCKMGIEVYHDLKDRDFNAGPGVCGDGMESVRHCQKSVFVLILVYIPAAIRRGSLT